MSFDYETHATAARHAAEVLHAAFRARPQVAGGRVRGQHGRTERDAAERAWRRAAEDFHAAVAAAYSPGFWDAYAALGRGDPSGLPEAVAFLEADPWFFRSGYTKAALIERLTRLPLDHAIADRLRRVVLAAVDGRDRREFRRYCRLARAVDAPTLREALRARLDAPDAGVRRRARWVLDALPQ